MLPLEDDGKIEAEKRGQGARGFEEGGGGGGGGVHLFIYSLGIFFFLQLERHLSSISGQRMAMSSIHVFAKKLNT